MHFVPRACSRAFVMKVSSWRMKQKIRRSAFITWRIQKPPLSIWRHTWWHAHEKKHVYFVVVIVVLWIALVVTFQTNQWKYTNAPSLFFTGYQAPRRGSHGVSRTRASRRNWTFAETTRHAVCSRQSATGGRRRRHKLCSRNLQPHSFSHDGRFASRLVSI